MRVHPRAPSNPVTDTNRCAARPREPGRSRTAVHSEGDSQALTPQAARNGEGVALTRQTAGSRDDNDVTQTTIAADHRSGGRLAHTGELGLRIPSSEGTNQRRREHHVTDQ